MDEEDARAALVAENKQLKEKLAKLREGKFSKKDAHEINLQRIRIEGHVERLMK